MQRQIPVLPIRLTLTSLGAVVLALLAGALLIAWSGVYNVAASRSHWPVTEWFLRFVMTNSVETHSAFIKPPPLGDRNLIQLGAAHFHGGCAPCHGAPGQEPSPITRAMLPAPPDLSTAVPAWESRHLFWIVKHGIKYAGMPGWVAPERDDEVWVVAAFLKRLPGMSAGQYNELALGNVRALNLSADEILRIGTVRTAIAACARCHGNADAPPVSNLVPKLAGQKQAYLERALQEYLLGQRASGIMQSVAAALDGDAIAQLAAYYAGLDWKESPSHPADPAQMELGRKIATMGLAEERIPPCLACHRETAAAAFPSLAGQYAPYLAGQLWLFKNGLRNRSANSRIMTVIASRLTAFQIQAVAAYLERLEPSSVSGRASAVR